MQLFYIYLSSLLAVKCFRKKNLVFWKLLGIITLEGMLQISGKPNVAKKALYDVSTLLHQNPRKDKPPSNFSMPIGGQGFPPSGTSMPNMLPPGNPIWSHRNPSSHGMPPMPWMGGFRNQPSGFVPGCIDGGPGQGGEASAEFSMKILCPAEKIGGVIGKGGFNVKQLQQETGASIHVQDATTEADERVIRVSAFEVFTFIWLINIVLWILFSSFITLHMDLGYKYYSYQQLLSSQLFMGSYIFKCCPYVTLDHYNVVSGSLEPKITYH